ncbi:hypothetical protein G5B39_09430 [Rhodobacteraceae bacterium SC52]|nr:hypothetical protein G5B39_09430 [Rhodobacteraceae bacterium SC52]
MEKVFALTKSAQAGLCVAAGVAVFFSSQVLADADGAGGVGPSDAILLDAPSVTGRINDGDESLVDTIYVYMDGCPIMSITPPAGGRGEPQVQMIDQSAGCVASRGTQDPADVAANGGGMRVKLWNDDPSLIEAVNGGEAANPRSLVVEVSSLYPDELPETTELMAGGTAPQFSIPGFLGDPSGELILASGEGTNGGSLLGAATGGGMLYAGGGSGGSGGNSGTDNGTGFFGGSDGSGGTGFLAIFGGEGSVPSVTAVPLPATLLLLLWALQLLRSRVRRA